jgi:hypothetical protein
MHRFLFVAFLFVAPGLSSFATLANVMQSSLHHNCDVQLALGLISAGRMSEPDPASGDDADAKCDRFWAEARMRHPGLLHGGLR